MKKKTVANGTAGPERSERALRWLAMALALACFVAAAACSGDVDGGMVRDGEAIDTWVVAEEPALPETAAVDEVASVTMETPEDAPGMYGDPPAVSWDDAENAYRAGRFGEAIDLLSAYAEVHPGHPWAHYMLGLAAWKAGHLEVAETHLLEAVALAPDDVRSRVNLARVLIEAGRPGEAVERAAAAEELDPASVQAKRVHARALAESGDHDSALDKYEDALWIDPDDGWSLNNMGYLLVQQGRHDDALGPLALAVRVDSTNVTFLNNFGSALEAAGFPVAALAAFRSAAEIDAGSRAAQSARRMAVLVEPDSVPEVTGEELALAYREELIIGSAARSDSAGHRFPNGGQFRSR